LPLTEKVTFKAVLQKGNRVQIPKLIRWQFKIEPDQTLKVAASALNTWTGSEYFYAKMGKDGRILIPKLTIALLGREKTDRAGYVLQVALEPA
jgi:hypothetical protein